MRLRIALIAPPYESVPPKLYGGTERVVHELACGLQSRHVETTVIGAGDSTVPGRLIASTPQALRLRPAPASDPALHQLASLALAASIADDFDLIHNHNDGWMLPLLRMSRTPVLTTLHGRLDQADLQMPLRAYSEARFIAISESQRSQGPALKWAATIPHGLDLSRFRFHPKPGKYLAFLGRITPEKRPDLAIRMALKADIPLKIAAKVEAGRDQEYFDAVIRPHLDGRQVEFIGEISESEKSEFLGNALALAFPIDWPEPFGLVMIESLACGTPVLARPMGSVPEVLSDGKTGFIDLDVDRLAARVRDLDKISRLECRAWVAERFSIDRMVEDHLRAYHQAISDRRNLVHSV